MTSIPQGVLLSDPKLEPETVPERPVRRKEGIRVWTKAIWAICLFANLLNLGNWADTVLWRGVDQGASGAAAAMAAAISVGAYVTARALTELIA